MPTQQGFAISSSFLMLIYFLRLDKQKAASTGMGPGTRATGVQWVVSSPVRESISRITCAPAAPFFAFRQSRPIMAS